MKVTFRCKQSGNTVSFTDETDIASMRKEEGYVEVTEITGAIDDVQTRQNANEGRRQETAAKEVKHRKSGDRSIDRLTDTSKAADVPVVAVEPVKKINFDMVI